MKPIVPLASRREYCRDRVPGGRHTSIATGYLSGARVVAVEVIATDGTTVARRAIRAEWLDVIRAALAHDTYTIDPVEIGRVPVHPGTAIRVSARRGSRHTITWRYVDLATNELLGWALTIAGDVQIDALSRAVADLDAEAAAAPPVTSRPPATTDDGLLTRRPARNRGWCPRTSPHPFSSLHSTSNPQRKAQS